MKKACLVTPSVFQQNRIFDLSDKVLNRDNCLIPFSLLKDEFAARDYDFSTQDINSINDSECVIFLEMPKILPAPDNVHKSHLLLFETDVILPRNWVMNNHKAFNKVFTWNDSLIDNQKYFKINWTYVLPEIPDYQLETRTRFCSLISGNKSASHPLELYSERVATIRWFERHHPDLFDLYGIGWNEFNLPGRRFIEQNPILKACSRLISRFAPQFPSYRGKVINKNETLRDYRFSICYENARDIPGYITEKIFDCLFAGCIPIYWGANNIATHIPPDCFIDRRKFASHEELFNHMHNFSDSEYRNCIEATRRFLKSDAARQFTAACFAKTVAEEALKAAFSEKPV
ncbi:MAG TPA: glycosyltransferase family 10 [Candidatus Rifleibacterium sp.]|nr:glycosyltransferase family 10 [Candidatus Rifleibacterium sp.]HPT47306.1 glycosyltransferase family 10 [Candidatus Rifleibacterium sp.]